MIRSPRARESWKYLRRAIATWLMLVSTSAIASEDDFLRPAPTTRWTFESNKCATQFKRMETLLNLWASGKALALDVLDRPDQNYWEGGLPFWAYKTQSVAMRETFGDLYYYGCAKSGNSPDKSTAFVMYERSAVNNSPSAQYKLGRMLIDGDGVAKNEDAGLAWISSAAIEGSREAASYLTQKGIEAPTPIWPNSYAVAASEAKEVFDGHRSAARAAIVRDLANLAIGVTAGYLGARAATPNIRAIYSGQEKLKAGYTPIPLATRAATMKRPTYCQYQGNVMNHSGGNTAYFYVTAFCN